MLERIIKAVFGEPEGKLEYISHYKGMLPEIRLDCDIDDAVKVLNKLSYDDIYFDFSPNLRKLTEEEKKEHDSLVGEETIGYDVVVEITLIPQPKYWKENIELRKKLSHSENHEM